MPQDPEKVLELLEKLAQEIKLKYKIEGVIYREDCDDFQILFEGNYHNEIRGKLIDIFLSDPRNADVLREIRFRLENPALFEDYEQAHDPNSAQPEDKIQIDDD